MTKRKPTSWGHFKYVKQYVMISWGTKLTIVFILFAGMMSYMVYQCVQTPVNLVTKEYYKDEIAYQQVIDGTNNANALGQAVSFQQSDTAIIIQLPSAMQGAVVKANVLFYCAKDAGKDKRFTLQTNGNTTQRINTTRVAPGNYMVKTEWWQGNRHYYNQQPVTIL